MHGKRKWLLLVSGEGTSEYLRKRRLISTIETSPSRNSLDNPAVGAISGHNNYVGYCTIRNGMPLHDLSNLTAKPQIFQPIGSDTYGSGVCTLPRQYWPSFAEAQPMTVNPPVLQTGLGIMGHAKSSTILSSKDVESQAVAQCCLQSQHEAITNIPLVLSKRESSV